MWRKKICAKDRGKWLLRRLGFCVLAVALPVLLCTRTDARLEDGSIKTEKEQIQTDRQEEETIFYRLFERAMAGANATVVPKDSYFKKQWALYNDGSVAYQERSQGMSWGLGWGGSSFFPGLFPNFFGSQNRIFTAQAGIDIGMEEAWGLYNGGVRETIVAVIDTGIDYSHEELKDAIWVNPDEIAGDGIDNDENGYVDDVYGWNFYEDSNKVYVGSEDDHGTHGAGTIAASRNGVGIAGIAGNSTVKIMSLKALGSSEGIGTPDSVIEAIHYAEAKGAVICNLSFGSELWDSSLEEAIRQSNMLFIVAVGNGDERTGAGYSLDNRPMYPAAYDLDNIISVANLQCDGKLHESSNYGKVSVDLAAPGSYIVSTITGNQYSYMSGTSMAAPMVTGVTALIYSQYNDITVAGVREVLLNSVTSLSSLSDLVATGGMLNAAAALRYDVSTLPENQVIEIEPVEVKTETEDMNTEDVNAATTQDVTTEHITLETEEGETNPEDQEEADLGMAPAISARVYDNNGTTKLQVTIQDEDGDLTEVRYLVGRKMAEDFAGGSLGKTFQLNSKNRKTFTPRAGRTYTFYARDEKGNETVLTVKAVIVIE